MSNFLTKNHKVLTIIGGIIIIGVITIGLLFGPFNNILPDSFREKLGYSIDSGDEKITVQLYIDFNGARDEINISISFQENQTATVYSILIKANLTVEFENYPNGKYIKSIEGIAEDSNHYWKYLVDDEAGTVAADRYNLRTEGTMRVSWLYNEY